MKTINMLTVLAGLLVLSLMVIPACDNMTGVSDNSANQEISSQVVERGVNTDHEIPGVDIPGVHGIFIDEIENKIWIGSPFNLEIKGYVGYLSDLDTPQDNPKLRQLYLDYKIDDGDWEIFASWSVNPADGLRSELISDRDDVPGREFGDSDINDFTNVLEITGVGSYSVRARATITGGDDPSAEETFSVTEETDFEVEFPAAPAIAARILEANGFSPRYGSGRFGGNFVADVAHTMGPGTDFLGEQKGNDDDTEMNQAYWDAVWCFLIDHPEMNDELEVEPAGYRSSWDGGPNCGENGDED